MSQTTEPKTAHKPAPPGALPITPEVAEQIRRDMAARVTAPGIMRKYRVNLQTIKVIRDGMRIESAASGASAASAESAASAASATATGAPAASTPPIGGPAPTPAPAPAPLAPAPAPAPAAGRDEEGVQGRAIELFTRGFLPTEVSATFRLTPEKTLQIARTFLGVGSA